MNWVKKSFWLLPFLIWLSISFWLFTLPGPAIPTIDWFDAIQGDKWAHITIFFFLCSLFYMGTIKMYYATRLTFLINYFGTAIFFLYGIAIEYIQRDYIMYRSFDVGDIIADGIGCLLALIFYKKIVTVITER